MIYFHLNQTKSNQRREVDTGDRTFLGHILVEQKIMFAILLSNNYLSLLFIM